MKPLSRCKAAVVLILVFLVGCGQGTAEDGVAESDNLDLISDRSAAPYFTAVIRLTSPALLTQTQTVNGKWVVDPTAKAKLLAEQKTFIASLKALPGGDKIKALYTSRLTLNSVSVLAPLELREKFVAMNGALDVEDEEMFESPPLSEIETTATAQALGTANSVNFIGADKVKSQLGFTGKGIRVGIIDTGIDYTHKMFGGAGTVAAFKNNNPNLVESGSFPTSKVVGGIDLVGSKYFPSATTLGERIPIPDNDPLDQNGHGSHVAGTVAGKGDGVNTYDGVAPDALLYAIKVFSTHGSTGTAPILAAFEYAADPNKDLDPNDHLDVVNLSLGAEFGTRFVSYIDVIKNLASVGVVTVCAGGNSGVTNPFAVGSPSIAEEAISVAAVIDNSPQNWRFPALRFSVNGKVSDEYVVASSDGKSIAEAGAIQGPLVYVQHQPYVDVPPHVPPLKGKFAVLDYEGIGNTLTPVLNAGPLGIILVVFGEDVSEGSLGGDLEEKVKIPIVGVKASFGATLKAALKASQPATVTFGPFIRENPELIDSMTKFSSRGPRSLDGLIKPELAGPGYKVTSAQMGGGNLGVRFSGTSMATPHVAGAAALLRQAFPNATARAIKSRLMNTSTLTVTDVGGLKPSVVAQRGAGRVRIYEAIKSTVEATPPALSLGIVPAASVFQQTRSLSLRNTANVVSQVKFTYPNSAGLTVTGPATLTLQPMQTQSVALNVIVSLSSQQGNTAEVSGDVKLEAGGIAQTIPVLAIGKRGSDIAMTSFSRSGTSQINLSLTNKGALAGEAIPFNFLGANQVTSAEAKANACALAQVGYRVVPVTVKGTNVKMLQFGMRLSSSISSWRNCQLSVQFDSNNDGVAEQELGGMLDESFILHPAFDPDNLTLKDSTWPYLSFLIDAKKMRQIQIDNAKAGTPVRGNFEAVIDYMPFGTYDYSNLGIVWADLSKVSKLADGTLRVKVAALPYYEGGIKDHYLLSAKNNWFTIDPKKIPYSNLPTALTLKPGTKTNFSATRTQPGSLIFFFPKNDGVSGTALKIPDVGAPSSQ